MENLLPNNIICKICNSRTLLFDVVDFNKCALENQYPFGLSGVPVYYYRCNNCSFIFTTFFDHFSSSDFKFKVYNSDYYSIVDPDYSSKRPLNNSILINSIIGSNQHFIGVDYGGGNGTTAKLISNKIINYDCIDPFGSNTFATNSIGKYNFCSAFEVFEHTCEPYSTLNHIISICDPEKLILIVGTSTSDKFINNQDRLSWWYASPRNGHVSLHSKASLKILGNHLGFSVFNFKNLHVFYKGFTKFFILRLFFYGFIRYKFVKFFVSS